MVTSSLNDKSSPAEITCGNCGAASPPGKRFCAECGCPLPSQPAAASPRAAEPAAAAPASSNAEAPSFSVRTWFRSILGQQLDASILDLGQVRGLAAALRLARDQKLIAEDKLKSVHRLLQVKGPNDTVWTVGLGSLRWNRFANGKWEPAEPPENVYLDVQMLKAIVALTEQPTTSPEAPK
jgi:hypothetical protein